MKEGQVQYELMVIINSEIGQDAVKAKLAGIKKQLEEHGEIFFEENWGERTLGYPMKGKTKGVYAVYDFHFEPKELKELESGLILDLDVIRHMIIKLPLKYEPKSLADLEAKAEAAAVERAAEKRPHSRRS